jgi:hypothetical protein
MVTNSAARGGEGERGQEYAAGRAEGKARLLPHARGPQFRLRRADDLLQQLLRCGPWRCRHREAGLRLCGGEKGREEK